MVSYLTRMPAGIAGVLTRTEHATVEPGLYSASAPFTAFGLAAKLSSGAYVPFSGGEAATALAGINVKPFPYQSSSTASDALGVATPSQTGGIGSFLKRGYMTILLNGGATVAKGGQVYIRVAAAATGKPIGGFEGAADSTNTVAPAGLTFMGPADANGNEEIAYNI